MSLYLPTIATLAHSAVSGKDRGRVAFVSEGPHFKSWLCRWAAILLTSFSLCYLTRDQYLLVWDWLGIIQGNTCKGCLLSIYDASLPPPNGSCCFSNTSFSLITFGSYPRGQSFTFILPLFWGDGYNRGEYIYSLQEHTKHNRLVPQKAGAVAFHTAHPVQQCCCQEPLLTTISCSLMCPCYGISILK